MTSPPSPHDCDQFFKLRDATALLPQDAAAAWLLLNPALIACARAWGGWRPFEGDVPEVLGRVDAELALRAMEAAA